MFHGRFISGVCAALVLTLGVTPLALAGSKVNVGKSVPASRQVSMDKIDHGRWDSLLHKYVDLDGWVDYTGWKASAADQRALDAYLDSLSRAGTNLKAGREAKLAFWINAYNALTVKGILREYPTSSIRNHTAKLIGYNIWKDLLLMVGGEPYSLEQIEHEVLRKMGEPRIHFAIVCASIGCPPLANAAYLPQRLDEQLTANAKAFFAQSSKFRYDEKARRIEVSPILEWFAEDFGADTAEQMRTIAPYLPGAAAQSMAAGSKARVSYLDYDWALNDQAKRPQKTARRK